MRSIIDIVLQMLSINSPCTLEFQMTHGSSYVDDVVKPNFGSMYDVMRTPSTNHLKIL